MIVEINKKYCLMYHPSACIFKNKKKVNFEAA